MEKAEVKKEIPDEMNFLLFCVRAFIEPHSREHLELLSVDNLEWLQLITSAQHHRLIPLVYNVLTLNKIKYPIGIQKKLRKARDNCVRRSLSQLAELKKILDIFSERRIEVVVLKGLVLAQEVYGGLANRTSNDIDLLVRPSDSNEAISCLFDMGYQTKLKREDLCYSQLMEKLRLFSGKDITFSSPEMGVIVELHWRAVESYSSFSLTANDFRHRNRIITSGVSVPIVGWEEHFMYLCYHGARHGWNRLFWLCDIALLFSRKELDWWWVKKESGRLGIQTILVMAVTLIQDLFNTPVPQELIEDSNYSSKGKKLAQKVRDRIFRYKSVSDLPNMVVMQGYQSLLWNMQLEPRCLNRLRMLFMILCPNDRDIKFIKLPACFAILYFFVHPLRLLYRVSVATKESVQVIFVVMRKAFSPRVLKLKGGKNRCQIGTLSEPNPNRKGGP